MNHKDTQVQSSERDLELAYKSILATLGKGVNQEGTTKTPVRAARAFEFLTRGYSQDIQHVVNGALFRSESDEMIIVKDIEMYSLCEHHLLPFIGRAHVAYMPKGKIIGLSKVARIVDMFARRLQVQERLTKEIAENLMAVTGAAGVGVVIEAKHLCLMMRGVEKQNSTMTTSCVLGTFRENDATRREFLSLLR